MARELARILNNYRRRKRLSIEDVARESGIPETDIRRFESASHAPDIPELISLAAVYGVPAWRIAKRVQACAVCLEEKNAAPRRAAS